MAVVPDLLELTRVGFLLADAEGRVQFANPAARKLLQARDDLTLLPSELSSGEAASLGLECQTQTLGAGQHLYVLRSLQDSPIFHLEWRLESSQERIRELEEELGRQVQAPLATPAQGQELVQELLRREAELQAELRQTRLQAGWASQLEEKLATQQQQLGKLRSELKISQMQRALAEDRQREEAGRVAELTARVSELAGQLARLPSPQELEGLRQRAERAELRLKVWEDLGELESLLELSENRADEAAARARQAEQELEERRSEVNRLARNLQAWEQERHNLHEQVQEFEQLLEDAEQRAEEAELQAVKIGSSMRDFVRSAEQRALAAEKKLRQLTAARLNREELAHLRDLETQLLTEQKMRFELQARVAELETRLKVVSRR